MLEKYLILLIRLHAIAALRSFTTSAIPLLNSSSEIDPVLDCIHEF